MPVSSQRTQEERTIAEPAEHVMFEREGFDEKQLRRDLAQTTPINIDDFHVERDDVEFVDPRTLDMPTLSGMGETGGSGIQTLRLDGERWRTYRFVHGFSTLREDDTSTERQSQATMEMFQFFADVAFFTGLGPSGNLASGVFDYMRSNIPAPRTFDCEDFDGDSGDVADLNGTEEDLFNYHIMKELRGRVLDVNDGWDAVVGSHGALVNFGKLSGAEGGEPGREYWDRLSDVLGERIRIPYTTQPTVLPRDLSSTEDSELNASDLQVDLADPDTAVNPGSAPIGDDELFLIPDMDIASSEFWRTYEMGAPDVFGPIEERGGKEFFDWVWRYTHKFDPSGQYPELADAVHVKNVSELFD